MDEVSNIPVDVTVILLEGKRYLLLTFNCETVSVPWPRGAGFYETLALALRKHQKNAEWPTAYDSLCDPRWVTDDPA